MNTSVWAEALVSSAYFALGVLCSELASLKPFAHKKALGYPAEFAAGLCIGALFIAVTELFFGGVAGVAAYSAFALGVAAKVAAALAGDPVKPEKSRPDIPRKKCRKKNDCENVCLSAPETKRAAGITLIRKIRAAK